MSNTEILDAIVVTCTTELFAHHAIELRRVASASGEMEYAALIGFASDEARGVVGLGMEGRTLRNLSELVEAGRTTASEDWLGENVNQLLGRIKNSLMRYGVVVSIALPTVLRGVRIQLMPHGVCGVSTHIFDSSLGTICSWVDVRWSDDRQLTLTSDPDMRGAPEGEMILF